MDDELKKIFGELKSSKEEQKSGIGSSRQAQLFPETLEKLRQLGERIRLARKRRKLTLDSVTERTGLSKPTLISLEKGSPKASLGAYAAVLFCLGLESDLDLIANDDRLGRTLQDIELNKKKRKGRKDGTSD